MDETYQNSFLIDGTADISLWAFIPVRLMYKRPEGTTFNCKPIHNGHVDWGHDMYLADNTSKIREYVTTGHISGKQQKYDSDQVQQNYTFSPMVSHIVANILIMAS
jgi:hypothetical protein